MKIVLCYALISSLINLAHLWCFHLAINTAQFFDNYFPVDFDLSLFSILQKSDGCEYKLFFFLPMGDLLFNSQDLIVNSLLLLLHDSL